MTQREPQSSAEYHQQRGVAWDIIDEAILTYDEWMLDDDYDAITVLHKIIGRMRERRGLYQVTDGETENQEGTKCRS